MEANTMFEAGKVFNFAEQIKYADGGVVSKQVLKNDAGNITLFAFDKDQGLSEHTAPYNAMVQILDGEVEINLDGKVHKLKKDEMIIMPANVPHSLHATKRMKMLLTMIKG